MSKIIGRPLYAPAPAGGATAGNLAVGSSVFTNVNGTKTEFIVVHQGKPSSLYDDSCNGTWLLMKDIYENREWNSSGTNNLENSTIHSYLNGTFFNLFDINIKDIIKQVKIPYHKGGGSGGTDQSGTHGLSTKIFLLSGYEVGYTNSDSSHIPVDGAKLDYFVAGFSGNSTRIANFNGKAARWWYRSPYINDVYYVFGAYEGGGLNNSGAINSFGIRPAFILPSEAKISKNGLIKP